MKKGILILSIIIGLILSSIFIRVIYVENNNSTLSNNTKSNSTNEIDFQKETINNEKIDLSNVYPKKEGFTWYYAGPLDTGKIITINSVFLSEDKITVNTKILEETRVGEDSPEERIKNGYYTIEKDRIIENERIVLQNPLEVGNSWINKNILIFPGIRYKSAINLQALTRIIRIEDGVIITETVITGIEGFKNNTYKETSKYKEGLGLINRVFDYQGVEDYTMFLRIKKWAEQPINKEKWYLEK